MVVVIEGGPRRPEDVTHTSSLGLSVCLSCLTMSACVPPPRVEHVVDQRQCVFLLQAVRVADDFGIRPFGVDLFCKGSVVVAGIAGACVDTSGAMG